MIQTRTTLIERNATRQETAVEFSFRTSANNEAKTTTAQIQDAVQGLTCTACEKPAGVVNVEANYDGVQVTVTDTCCPAMFDTITTALIEA